MRGVTLEEISSATRIGTRFLDALETEHWDRLPGGVFNRGFVRTTSQFLGLDPEAMLAEYTLATADSARSAPPVLIHSQSSWTPRAASSPSDRRWVALAALFAMVAIAAGGWFGWRHYRALRRARAADAELSAAPNVAATSDTLSASEPAAPADPNAPAASVAASPDASPSAPQPAADSSAAPGGSTSAPASSPASASDVPTTSADSAPAAAAAAAPSATSAASAGASASGPLILKIEAGRKTEVRVSVDGRKTFDGKIPAGGSRTFQANLVFYVTARDAGGVLLELNGQTLPPLGPQGHSASIRLSRDTLKAQDGMSH